MAEEEKPSGLMSPAVNMAVDMSDRLINPNIAFQEAQKKGTFSFLPLRVPQKDEVEQLKETVPAKLEELDSPYLSENCLLYTSDAADE